MVWSLSVDLLQVVLVCSAEAREDGCGPRVEGVRLASAVLYSPQGLQSTISSSSSWSGEIEVSKLNDAHWKRSNGMSSGLGPGL